MQWEQRQKIFLYSLHYILINTYLCYQSPPMRTKVNDFCLTIILWLVTEKHFSALYGNSCTGWVYNVDNVDKVAHSTNKACRKIIKGNISWLVSLCTSIFRRAFQRGLNIVMAATFSSRGFTIGCQFRVSNWRGAISFIKNSINKTKGSNIWSTLLNK